METIKHAAVISESGKIFFGKSHADCFHKAHHLKIKMSQSAYDQGFLTSEGRYIQRGEAYKVALKAGQIVPKNYDRDPDIFDIGPSARVPLLFSEDLWCERYGGKYDHDEIKGYIEKTSEVMSEDLAP